MCYFVCILLRGHCNPHISLPCPICCVFHSLSHLIRTVVFNLLWHKAVMTELPSSDGWPARSQPLNLSLIHPHSSICSSRAQTITSHTAINLPTCSLIPISFFFPRPQKYSPWSGSWRWKSFLMGLTHFIKCDRVTVSTFTGTRFGVNCDIKKKGLVTGDFWCIKFYLSKLDKSSEFNLNSNSEL